MANAPAPGPAEAYDRYLGPALFEPWAQILLQRAVPRAGEHALDLACGTGIVTRQLAPLLGADGRVVAVDISPDMLAVARAKPALEGAPIEWRQGDAGALDLPDAAFDLLVCQQGLQFFPDRAGAVRGMHRVLRPGGRAALAVWLGLQDHALFRAMFEAEGGHLGVPPERLAMPFSLADPEAIRDLFVAAGFSKVTIEVHARDAAFPEPERFVGLVVTAGAAVIPELALDEAGHQALVRVVLAETAAVLAAHRQGDHLVIPMRAHLVLARR